MTKFTVQDIENIENIAEDLKEHFCSLQRAINSGTGWSLQGSYGRAMMEAISNGMCMLGVDSITDYYGNRIPSRTEVRAGAKGSREYVVMEMGEEFATMLEGV